MMKVKTMGLIKKIVHALVTLIIGVIAAATLYFIVISVLPTSEVKRDSVIIGIRYQADFAEENCYFFGTPLRVPQNPGEYLGCEPYLLTLPDMFNMWVAKTFHLKI